MTFQTIALIKLHISHVLPVELLSKPSKPENQPQGLNDECFESAAPDMKSVSNIIKHFQLLNIKHFLKLKLIIYSLPTLV